MEALFKQMFNDGWSFAEAFGEMCRLMGHQPIQEWKRLWDQLRLERQAHTAAIVRQQEEGV